MFYVYIISNNFRNVLYIGVTRNLERRLYEHKNKLLEGFSKKYNLNVLLFYETTEYALDAIAREKQLKKWNREKKFDLIKSLNPELRDLSEDWWLLYESFTGLTIACEQAIVEIFRLRSRWRVGSFTFQRAMTWIVLFSMQLLKEFWIFFTFNV